MRRVTFLLLACAAVAVGARAQAQVLCCSITAIDTATGVVSAKVNASGAAFQFKMTNAILLKGLRVGQGVYANFGDKQVSLDGKSIAGHITAGPQAPATTPAATLVRPPVTTSIPTSAAFSGTGPCCSVTAVSSPSLITARTSAGAYFIFSLNAARLIQLSVTVNQKVYANFTTKQVSLDGTSDVGTIKYLCAVPQNQPCPAGAASCVTEPFTGGQGCPSQTVQTSTPASCKHGYYGRLCMICPPCQSPSVCSDGLSGSGTCQN